MKLEIIVSCLFTTLALASAGTLRHHPRGLIQDKDRYVRATGPQTNFQMGVYLGKGSFVVLPTVENVFGETRGVVNEYAAKMEVTYNSITNHMSFNSNEDTKSQSVNVAFVEDGSFYAEGLSGTCTKNTMTDTKTYAVRTTSIQCDWQVEDKDGGYLNNHVLWSGDTMNLIAVNGWKITGDGHTIRWHEQLERIAQSPVMASNDKEILPLRFTQGQDTTLLKKSTFSAMSSYHNHTLWSDGKATVQQMIEAAAGSASMSLAYRITTRCFPGIRKLNGQSTVIVWVATSMS